MIKNAPKFWFKDSAVSKLLIPFAKIYSLLAVYNMNQKPKYKASVPVLCCGNFIVGGSGKTPTCIALAKIANKLNIKVGFLTRGYKRQTKNNFIVKKGHTAKQVGDESVLLAQHAICVVAKNRIIGAKMLEAKKVDLIIMDDGFQNNKLHKDFNLLVVDTKKSIGNARCLPAGPLRVPLAVQMQHAHAILFVGKNKVKFKIAKHIKKLYAKRVITNGNEFKNKNIFAFAGIANCQQFFTSLKNCGANLLAKKSFADHHHFSKNECKKLLEKAKKENLMLVATAKDFVKLDVSNPIKHQVKVAKLEMKIKNEAEISNLLLALTAKK